MQSNACVYLGKLGPAARDAVPALVSYLEKAAGKPTGGSLEAMWALGRIGPSSEQAIPVLVRLAKLGELSWYERNKIEETLRDIGSKARLAREDVIHFNQALAAQELPEKIQALNSASPEEVGHAADALATMGAYALPALPALQNRLAEINGDGKYSESAGTRIKAAVNSISSAGRASGLK